MAVGKFDFFSESLQKTTTFSIMLPNDIPEVFRKGPRFSRPMKTLYLLHGYCGHNMDWICNSEIGDLVGKYNLCVVFPNGDNSFYLDGKETGRKYATFTGEEIVSYTRKTFGLSDRVEDTFIGGFSMGGFGAIHTALQYNHTFSKVIALSSALIVHKFEQMKEDADDGTANYAYYKMIFGAPEQLAKSCNNPEELVRRLCKRAERIPEIYMACGTEDFLIEDNRAFRTFLEKQNISVSYHESAGIHDFKFWNQYLEPAICWLLDEK